MKDPYIVSWKLSTETSSHLAELREQLARFANPSVAIMDKTVTLENEREAIKEHIIQVGEYFDRFCVLPAPEEPLPSIRLFFQRRIEATRFWKDVMASILREARGLDAKVWIALDYKVVDDSAYRIATEIPRWLAHLGEASRTFWSTSARYLLTHNEFTFTDIEEFSGIPRESLRASHRNSYRAIRKERASSPLWSKWDYISERCIYSMEQVVRDELLCLTQRD